ncbi:hypothetical protein BWQ96_09674 [Gracilariopsis chorda]|uniref:Uncharacterized protein n=1 Tax=Gracilariopsis chorda TaxID=448386 RepID=A0A2V3IEY7_9FLOR|nr:hypothetical protein BWQ96_09674 [Gracilariopsis chorda]|eukprot:PXF40611.1 hypothetical protein BWQ96_09674 [Gracilariopsis chorda]
MVLVPTTPATLAVVIGVIELLILEAFRTLLNAALAARRRVKLSRLGRLHLYSAARQNDWLQLWITVVSITLVVVVIILELSIDGLILRNTGSRIRAQCFAPERLTRYWGGFGPSASEADDTRFGQYLEQTACGDSLLRSAISGTSGLQIGYPQCTARFGPARPRQLSFELQGCGVGFVSASSAGDFHCDLLPVGIGFPRTLAGTNFVAVLETGHNSSSDFEFNDEPAQRYLSNSRIPSSWMLNSTGSSVEVPCTSLGLDCYTLSRERAATAPKSVRQSTAPAGVYIQVLENGNSSVCLFESGMQSRAEWLEMNQLLPGGEERDSRRGPVLTAFQVRGNARCIERLDAAVARLHYDAVEFTTGPPESGLLEWLQRHVVATGIKTAVENEVPCTVFEAIEGSSISTGWLVAASVLSGLLIVVSGVAMGYAVWTHFSKAAKQDPLTPIWSMWEVLRARQAWDGSSQRMDGKPCDVYVGVVEEEGEARFEVYAEAEFETVRRSTLPFVM